MATAADAHGAGFAGNVTFRSLRSAQNVVYFGRTLGSECQRCGAYDQNEHGHRFCAHVSCPIALLEVKRRNRRRTSRLETVYFPDHALLTRNKEQGREHDQDPARR